MDMVFKQVCYTLFVVYLVRQKLSLKNIINYLLTCTKQALGKSVIDNYVGPVFLQFRPNVLALLGHQGTCQQRKKKGKKTPL